MKKTDFWPSKQPSDHRIIFPNLHDFCDHGDLSCISEQTLDPPNIWLISCRQNVIPLKTLNSLRGYKTVSGTGMRVRHSVGVLRDMACACVFVPVQKMEIGKIMRTCANSYLEYIFS